MSSIENPDRIADLITHFKTTFPAETRPALLQQVIPTLLYAITDIANELRRSQNVSQVGTANAFGDDQLNVDVATENLMRSALAKCPAVKTASSEEDPIERPSNSIADQSNTSEEYTVAFDPLDGSSIIAPNWTVGTIIGIWDGPTALNQDPREKQVAAILGVLGPRTTAVIALRLPGQDPVCMEVGISDSKIEVVRTGVKLQNAPFKTRYFAPANLRAAADDEKYMALISYYINQKYTLRYCGGLVPDIVHALVKGHGIYVSPVTDSSKAKLRKMFELAPVALIIECAGGRAVDAKTGKDILETAIEDINEKGGLTCGTKEEVDLVLQKLHE
ncbi:sedoheptulose-1,7-bisphosphatase [Amniculicola lignicola CBS 123094]|uniref:Sedoheptulose-1,7-bisphosphatase n=1 Tax=Amniculicola lignicola CBS 123094 TaxID=1392246 RepID=A0A6A5WMV2_9PLEO|nr:sedoheptulose-1,7-bisphosphatase [Amniculicola lignicola CBS 123094]